MAYRAEKKLSQRADELIEMMGLSDFRDKFVSDLSTGSRRIVDLACQIGIDPKVILFDEPSSGIAQRETEALGPLLVRIQEQTGASLLLIEHDMPLITSVSDRIVAMDLGAVVVDGDAETVLNHPHVVASYLGSNREAIERSGAQQQGPRSDAWGGQSMSTTFAGTTSSTEPEVKRRGIRGFLDRYKTSYQVARASLFWALLRRQKRTLGWMFFAFVLNSIALLQIANFTRNMVDNAIVDQLTPIWPWVVKIFIWACISFVTGLAGTMLLQRIGYQLEFDLRVWLYTHIQSADLRRLDAVASGQLVTRSLTDLALIEQLLLVFPAIISYLPLLLALGILVIILSPPMGILALSAVPLNLWLISRFRVRLRGLSWAELNERAEVMRTIDEPVRGIRVVKAFGREDDRGREGPHGHGEGVPLLDDARAPARAVRRRPEAGAVHHPGVGARARRAPHRVGRPQPRHLPARVPDLHRPRDDLRELRRVRQRVAVPARRAGPHRRDARPRRPAGHRRAHGARAVLRPRAARRRCRPRQPARARRLRTSRSRRARSSSSPGLPAPGSRPSPRWHPAC